MSFLRDLKVAIRSLARVPALWFTVAITLALGIGANAAIFSVVRGVLLRPLANRDEDRLLYVRQSAPGIGVPNARATCPLCCSWSNDPPVIPKISRNSSRERCCISLRFLHVIDQMHSYTYIILR